MMVSIGSISWTRAILRENGYSLTDNQWDDFVRLMCRTAEEWFEAEGLDTPWAEEVSE